jgi:hypothetical protein
MTSGPETEDTTIWRLDESGACWSSSTSSIPRWRVSGPMRTIGIEEAKKQILAALLQEDTDGSLVPYLEKRWGTAK